MNSGTISRPLFLQQLVFLFLLGLGISSCTPDKQVKIYSNIPVSIDQEMALDTNKALNSSTQSLNRYHSILREHNQLKVEYSKKAKVLNLGLEAPSKNTGVVFHNINTQFLVPLLPYKHNNILDDFDKANLLLAEYARNGISLSYQTDNKEFAFFNTSEENIFNEDGEFIYSASGTIEPNPKVKPKRMSVINNCLNPSLWEISATDAVGEMFHGWFTLPKDLYFDMVKHQNGIENSTEELYKYIDSPPNLETIPLDLDRFRKQKKLIATAIPQVAGEKLVDGYSSQDSRRKVQRGFYCILRDSQKLEAASFADLLPGDLFDMHSFKPPGIYDKNERMQTAYNPAWDQVEFYDVQPLTSYGGKHDGYGKYGYLEIHLKSSTNNERIIAGNIPIQLLVLSEDYKIPGFGVGVLASSELVERRYLRLKEGTYPHYAYLTKERDDQLYLMNNHPVGYEQIYLRPFQKEGKTYLRMTIVSYERIVDLLEFNIPIHGDLEQLVLKASASYKPPIYEVYQDTNIL